MKLLAAVAAVSGLFQQRYRPEVHYMRGPGPACAAKRRAGEAEERASANADAPAGSTKGDAPAQ